MKSAIAILLSVFLSLAHAGDALTGRGAQMDHGPFVSAAISDVPAPHFRDVFPRPGKANIACKGLAIRLGHGAYMCFDADLLRMAFGWTAPADAAGPTAGLVVKNTMLAETKGLLNPTIAGTLRFSTKMAPGWSATPDFPDSRQYAFGPLPKNAAHFKGLYLSGGKVILKYTVAGVEILEVPSAIQNGLCLTRTFRVGPGGALHLRLCDVPGILEPATATDIQACVSDARLLVGVFKAPAGVKLEARNGVAQVALEARKEPVQFTVGLCEAKETSYSVDSKLNPLSTVSVDFDALFKTDSPRWPAPVVTKGTLGDDKGAFALDTLTLPEDTPYKAWMRLSALDFFPDGRAAVATLNGDVWIVSGIDATLSQLSWKRYATGLFEPLGLRVVDGAIYVLGRDQLTKLHDRNGDGEADFYENINNDGVTSASYGGFAMDLITDTAGNFYYGRSGHHGAEGLPLNNGIYRVSKDGSKLETFAHGMRVPNGLGISPAGEITFGDNQGNYVPASKLSVVKPGGFYGYLMEPDPKKPLPAQYEQPMLWLPQTMDSSSGSQEWVPPGVKGPWSVYANRMLHTSYGKGKLLLVLRDGTNAAAAAPFPLAFDTGIMRARFNPRDGQFYAVGLGGGWQSGGPKHGGFNRVRLTGKPLPLPVAFAVKKDALEFTFAQPLDKAAAADAGNYSAEQWNYVYSAAYGSPEYSVADPKKKGHDPVDIKAAQLSADGKTVRLEIPDLAPVMQFKVKYKLDATDGSPLNGELYATIQTVPR